MHFHLFTLIATFVASAAAAATTKHDTAPFTLTFFPFNTDQCEMKAAELPHGHGGNGTIPARVRLTEGNCSDVPYSYESFSTFVAENQTSRLTTGSGCYLSLYIQTNCGVGTGGFVNATKLDVLSYPSCQIPGGRDAFKSVLVNCDAA